MHDAYLGDGAGGDNSTAEVDYPYDEWRRFVAVFGEAVTPLVVGLPADARRALRLADAVDRSRHSPWSRSHDEGSAAAISTEQRRVFPQPRAKPTRIHTHSRSQRSST